MHTNPVDEIISRLKGCKKIVFHCMYSQQRGPRCAGKMKERLVRRNKEDGGNDEPDLKVYILEGGFKTFFSLHPEWCTSQL